MAKLTGRLWHPFLDTDEQSPALPAAATKPYHEEQ